MSPASVLNHEATHATRHLKFIKRAKEIKQKVYDAIWSDFRYGENTRKYKSMKEASDAAHKEAQKAYNKVAVEEYNAYTTYDYEKMPDYGSQNELENISISEQYTAHKTGEVPENQVTRTDHFDGTFVEVESVRSKPDVPNKNNE